MKQIILFVILTSLLVSGCATMPVVQPTFEEYEAAKLQKKTVAVVEISELGSSVKGINQAVISELESIIIDHFNVVERTRIEPILAEREFQQQGSVEQKAEIGKILGADFVMYGTTVTSMVGPKVRSNHSRTEEGVFSGDIWYEVTASSEINVKVVDVKNGMIHSSIVGSGYSKEELNRMAFTDEGKFNRELSKSRGEVEVEDFNKLDDEFEVVLARALYDAVETVGRKVIKKYGCKDGEVLKIISDTEVIVNIGSAFGIKPGDQLVIWEEYNEMVDPRTGLNVSPKSQKGMLKVTQVSSGLTCVAKGRKKTVENIRVGDKVTVY